MSGDMVQGPYLAEDAKLRDDGRATFSGHCRELCRITGTKVTTEEGPGKCETFENFVRDNTYPVKSIHTCRNTPADYLINCKLRLDTTTVLEKVSIIHLKPKTAKTVRD